MPLTFPIVLDSDYSSALGLLLRYPSPEPFTAVDFVLDALFLSRNPSPQGAASLVSKYSGRVHRQLRGQSVDSVLKANGPRLTPQRTLASREPRRPATETLTPSKSPARIGAKRFDSIFHDVSEGLYRRTENWGLAKAVRGAVGEARRNMQQQLQSSASSPGFIDDSESKSAIPRLSLAVHEELNSRISALEERNKLLAKMLGEAMGTLMSQRDEKGPGNESKEKDTKERNQAFDKIKYVQTRLENSDLPVIRQEPDDNGRKSTTDNIPTPASNDTRPSPDINLTTQHQHPTNKKENVQPNSTTEPSIAIPQNPKAPTTATATATTATTKVETPLPVRPIQRAPLAESSQFSWMLGDTGPRSSFMTCASAPPEREREAEKSEKRGLGRPHYLFGDARSENGGSGRDRDGEEENVMALGPLGRISEQ